MESADLLGAYLDVLAELASLAGVAYVSVAQPFLDPLRHGIDLLTGTTGPQSLEVGLVTNFTKLTTGVYVVMRAPKVEIRLQDLRVDSNYSLTHINGADLSRFPYMVLTVEGDVTRPDWRGIPDVGSRWDELAETLEADDPPVAENAMAVFRRMAYLSDDLLPEHARTLVNQVRG